MQLIKKKTTQKEIRTYKWIGCYVKYDLSKGKTMEYTHIYVRYIIFNLRIFVNLIYLMKVLVIQYIPLYCDELDSCMREAGRNDI